MRPQRTGGTLCPDLHSQLRSEIMCFAFHLAVAIFGLLRRRKDADNFACLGEKVRLPGYKEALTGTSVASALAAGLAARILDFSRHVDSREAGCDEQKLRTRPGMRAVFKKISHEDGLFRCIAPWLLGQMPSARSDTRPSREQVQNVIRKALKEMDR